MRPSTISCVLTALCSATYVLADAGQTQAAPPASVTDDAILAATPPEAELVVDGEPHLDLRQVTGQQPGVTQALTQYPSVTTQWLPSQIGSEVTYVSVIYTQTFAAIPDQWPSPGAGAIGYGTLSKAKRDEPEATPAPRRGIAGDVHTVVLAMETALVTLYLQPVTEVMVLHTITILPNMSDNATLHGTYNGTYNGTVNATIARNHSVPASIDPEVHRFPASTGLFGFF